MKLKKINASLGLLSVLFMLMHVGFSTYCYLFLYYNPVLKMVFAIPFMVLVCLHAVCGMLTVFLQKDGSRMDLYPRQNIKTILQRVSAALIFPLLILHINIFKLLTASAAGGHKVYILLLFLGEILFFATIFTHISISLSKAFVTLGLITSEKTVKRLDTFMYILCALIFSVASTVILKTQIGMFL